MTESLNAGDVLLPAVKTENSDTSLENIFQEAASLYSKRLYGQAETKFREALSINPNMPEIHINLGNIYFKKKNFTDAIECWKKALSLDPDRIICYTNIGNALYASKKIEEAISYWQNAIIAAPDHLQTILNLAAVYEQKKDFSDAFRYYEQYLKYSSNRNSVEYIKVFNKVTNSQKVASHNLQVGIKYQSSKSLRNAAIAYLKSIEVYPNFAKAHLNMGSICYMSDKLDHAVKYWLQSVRLDPTYPVAYCNLGVAYDRMKEYTYAYCMYKRYLKVTKGAGADRIITDRVAELKFIVDKNIENQKKHLQLAEKYFKNNLYYDSLWEYENYLLLSPEQSGSYANRISELNHILNPVKKAVKVAFDAAVKASNDCEFDNAVQYFRKCLFLDSKGELADKARKLMIECVQKNKKINPIGL